MRSVGPSEVAVEPLARKALHLAVRLEAVPLPAANVVRHLLLAQGGDVAVSEAAYYLRPAKATDMLLFGTLAQLGRLHERLSTEPPALRQLGAEVAETIARYLGPLPPGEFGPFRFDWAEHRYVAGILDLAGRAVEAAVGQGLKLADEGADLVEVSIPAPRPGRAQAAGEEARQLTAVVGRLAQRLSVPIAVSGAPYRVLAAAVKAGASVVTGVTGRGEEPLYSLVARASCGLVLRHSWGQAPRPRRLDRYSGALLGDVYDALQRRALRALAAGVRRNRIIVDPGLGKAGLPLLRRLPELRSLGFPISVDSPGRAASAEALAAYAMAQGAHILRTQSVREAKRAIAALAPVLRERP